MKRLIIACAAFLLLMIAAAVPLMAAETKIADVPPNHWAYQAVKKLVSQGYLGLYPDKTFRGDDPVDRYTLAFLVARLLEETVAGRAAATAEDAETLRRLTGEFRQELVSLTTRTEALKKSLDQYERDRTALGADMALWRDETTRARAELAEILSEVVTLQQRVAGLEESLTNLDSKTRDLDRKLEGLGQKVQAEDTKNAASAAENAQAISTLQDELAAEKQHTAELEKKVNTWRWVSMILAVVAGVLM